MSRFKVFDTIDKLMKLYEADEEMGAEGGDAPAPEGGGDEGGEVPQDATEAAPQDDQSQEAPPETDAAKTSVTISLAQKVDWANIMLRALQLDPKTLTIGALPSDLQKVTPQNVDKVINHVKVAVDSSAATSLNDKNIEGSLPDELASMSGGMN